MSVPIVVDFPVAFEAVRKNGRKKDVFINNVTVEVELETLSEDDAPEILRYYDFMWNAFRLDNKERFLWELQSAPYSGEHIKAERHDGAAVPRPGNIELKDLYPHFPRDLHPAVKSAYNSGSSWNVPKFDPDSFKEVDLLSVQNQISQRLETLKNYVIVGKLLCFRVEEPVLRLRHDGSAFLRADDPWHNAYPYGCYSFAELETAVAMARSMSPKFDREEFERPIQVTAVEALTPSFLDRRIALMSRWLIQRLPEYLTSVERNDAARFIATLPRMDQDLLRAICDALMKTDRGVIDADVLSVGEQVLTLPPSSQLDIAIQKIPDAKPMLHMLRSEWENRPVAVHF